MRIKENLRSDGIRMPAAIASEIPKRQLIRSALLPFFLSFLDASRNNDEGASQVSGGVSKLGRGDGRYWSRVKLLYQEEQVMLICFE
jgi:hypothetical protein